MRDKFIRAQQFVYRHRGTFGYLAGAGVVLTTSIVMKNQRRTFMIFLEETPEQIAKMIANDKSLSILTKKGSEILIVPAMNAEKLKAMM